MAVGDLIKKVFRPRHDYVPGTQIFSPVDVKRIKTELDLAARGAADGAKGIPASDARNFSETELEIVRKCDNWRGTALEEARRALEVYTSRIEHSYEGLESAKLRTMTREAKIDLEQLAEDEIAELAGYELEVQRRTGDFDKFKDKQRIDRSPRPSHDFWVALMPIAIAALFEIAANSFFFFEAGNDLGLLGAALEAVLIPLINISVSWMLTFWLVRQLWRRELLRKLLGMIGLIAFFAFILVFNLGVAHFRDALGAVGPEEAQSLALQSLFSDPFGLDAVYSWILCGLGMLVSFVTFGDALTYRDPIPEYSRLDNLRKDALGSFNDQRAGAVEAVQDRFEDHKSRLEAARRKLAQAQRDSLEIMTRVTHLQEDLDDFGTYLKATSEELAAAYRDSNRSARSQPAPAHFDLPIWTLHPMSLGTTLSALRNQAERWRSAPGEEDGEDILKRGLDQLNESLGESVEKLRKLRDFEDENARR